MNEVNDPPKLRTLGFVAEELGVPLHRVAYVLHTRKHIHPVAFAGRTRLFDRQTVAMIRHELIAIDANRDRTNNRHAPTEEPKRRGVKVGGR